MLRRARAVASLALAFTIAFGAASASAQTTSAVVVNTHDGMDMFRLVFQVRRAVGDVVAPQNAAVAFSSCTNCTTIAISIQIVFVMSDPNVFTPLNVAMAVNYECQTCMTVAEAFQFVIGAGAPLELTKEGRHSIEEIRRRLKELRAQDLSIADLQARIDALMVELQSVLATQLVPAKEPAPEASPDASPSGSVAPSPSESGSATPSPDASASPSESPTASPAPTVSP